MPQTTLHPSFSQLVQSRSKFRLFTLSKLPAAFFSGVQVEQFSADRCTASVPYKWFTQNPFSSTYFACLCMAAEMSTGVLAMAFTYRKKPAVSMLVVGMESKFYKKATGKTAFTCNDGALLQSAVEAAIATGEGQTVKAYSRGVNSACELVAEFWITWSFKAKAV
jgi:hypothetical protein